MWSGFGTILCWVLWVSCSGLPSLKGLPCSVHKDCGTSLVCWRKLCRGDLAEESTIKEFSGESRTETLIALTEPFGEHYIELPVVSDELTTQPFTECKFGETRFCGSNVGECEKGYRDGSVSEALFNYPASIAVDKQGNMYVADFYNHRIRKITPPKE